MCDEYVNISFVSSDDGEPVQIVSQSPDEIFKDVFQIGISNFCV